jgi:ATP-dependent helicase HrpB
LTPLLKRLGETRLPLVPHLEGIAAALEEREVLVLRSDPGSGKSTLLPPALLDRLGEGGKILMAEPRRAAVLGIAARMAELVGEECGERIGYAVRLEKRVSRRTRLEVLTEGLLIRRLQENPDLRGVETVILDEFHERSVHTDLALALLLDLRRMGARIRLLIMSATMDAAGIASFIDRTENRQGERRVPVFDVPGRCFPVEIRYRPLPERSSLGRETAAALEAILGEEPDHEALVFLPGRREIGEAGAALAGGRLGEKYRILPLHGSLPLARQREVIAGGGEGRRRIILSTNVAETGLTIPGITLVVDSGYVRVERYHLPTAMNRLCPEPASLRSADQRAGRAGRLSPGVCVRLWDPSRPRPRENEPEIRRVDLSAPVLECLLWGVRDREGLPWPEPPSPAAWDRALELLRDLGAAGETGQPTPKGKEMARLGLEPRLGSLCIAGKTAGQAPLACAAAAVLASRDQSGINGDGDFRRRLALVRHNAPGPWIRGVRENAADLLRRLKLDRLSLNWTAGEEAGAGELLAAAFPDRIARSREPGLFRFVSGREARLEGPLAREEWLVAAEADAGERTGFIRLAAPLSPEQALAFLEPQIREEKSLEWTGLIPRTLIVRSAGRLLISHEKRPAFREEVLADLPSMLKDRGLGVLPWEEAPRRLLDRIRFFAAHGRGKGASWGELWDESWDDEALIRDAPRWLGPFVWGGGETGKGPIIDGKGLRQALEFRLGREKSRDLAVLVPETFSLPRGRSRVIAYDSGEPVVRLRLQDAFGIPPVSPILNVPVVFHLLSPADRPIQITADLGGFWTGSYREVRRELRGRYPKHRWPENPMEG